MAVAGTLAERKVQAAGWLEEPVVAAARVECWHLGPLRVMVQREVP